MKRLNFVLLALLTLGVIGCAADGTSGESGVEQEIVPSAPTNLVATVVSAKQISLSWDPVANATAYIILKGTAPGNETTLTTNSPATATTFLDTNDTPNTQYCFEVRVYIAGQGTSGPSNEQCVTTASGPQPPTGVQAFAMSPTTITVTWNAVAGAVRYYVFESVAGGPFNQIGSVAAPTVSFTVGGLTPSTTYTFEIKTLASGNLFSNFSLPASATTFAAGLEQYFRFDDKTGTTAIDLSGFHRDGTLLGGAAFVTTDQAPVRDATDHNPSSVSLPTSTSNVSAPGSVNFTGDSTVSLWVKLPAAPTGPLSIIGRRGAGCGPIVWQLGQDATNGLHFDGGAVVRSFGQSLPVGTWTEVAVTQSAGTIQMYVAGALVSSASYAAGSANTVPLQIGDVGGCGNGGALLVDEVQIYSRALSATEIAALGTPPPAPANLVVDEIHSTRLLLSWTAVAGADHYLVYRGSASGNEVFFTSNPDTTFTADHLSPRQTTSWEVRAIRGGLLSAFSNELVVTTSPPPPAPTGLTATISTCCTPARVDLAWNAVTGSIRYYVLQSTSGGPFTQIGSVAAPTTKFQAANLTPGTTYAFEVEAQDDGLTFSAPSAPVSITTP